MNCIFVKCLPYYKLSDDVSTGGTEECYNPVFWDVTPCSLVDVSPFRRNLLTLQGRRQPEDGVGTFFKENP